MKEFLFKKYRLLNMSVTCEWMCLGCPLTGKRDNSDFLRTSVGQMLSEDKIKWVHVYGGNPLLESDSLLYLNRLKYDKKVKIGVWGHLGENIDDYYDFQDLVSQWYVYMPTAPQVEFEAFVQGCHYDAYENRIRDLKEAGFCMKLVHYVTPFSISSLPDVYEIAFRYSLPLILICSRSTFSSEEITYIKRYYHVKNVEVYMTSVDPVGCLGSPYKVFTAFQIIKNMIFETLNGIRLKYKL